MKNVLIVGMGRFGYHMALKLRELGHDVMAVDVREDCINECLPIVTNAMIGDATSEIFLRSLGVDNFDLCVVAIGNSFENSLQATALLKELGAPQVVSRANSPIHEKFLLNNGADHVIYPAKQTAEWAAVRYTSNRVLDYIEFAGDYSIIEAAIPADWVGKSVGELSVRHNYKLMILSALRNDQVTTMPEADYRFTEGERIYVFGHDKDLDKFLR